MARQKVDMKVLCVLMLFAVTLNSCWLVGGMSNRGGVIAGELVNASGLRVDYKSAVLKVVETGTNTGSGSQEYQQESQHPGVFFFRNLDDGTYAIEFLDDSGNEIPVEPFEVQLGVGRTKTIVVAVLPNEE